jgi:hypothetical protein
MCVHRPAPVHLAASAPSMQASDVPTHAATNKLRSLHGVNRRKLVKAPEWERG